MEADTKSITIEGFGAPDLHDSTVVQFLGLVFRQASQHGATQIVFSHEQNFAEGSATSATPASPQPASWDQGSNQNDTDALPGSLSDLDPVPPAVRATPRFAFAIKCVTPAGSRQLAPAPDYLYIPAANCLCAMADIRYWARGPVEGFIDMKIGGLGRIPLTVHSSNLREQITLSRATAEEIAAYDRRPPIAVPPLPGPLPDVPLPEFLYRPVSPPSRKHAVVWFVSRTVFYALAYIEVFLLVKFNASLGDALSAWLGTMFELAAKIMELPISLLPMDEYPKLQEWGWIQLLFWGAGLAYLAQRSTKRKA